MPHEVQIRICSDCWLCGPGQGELPQNVLTQRLAVQEIAACFGRPFIVFLNASDAVSDMDRVLGKVRVDNLAHALSLDMPWKKRRVIMVVIDSLYREIDVEGARSAYLGFFGSASWEEEGLVVLAELAYAHHQQLRTGQ